MSLVDDIRQYYLKHFDKLPFDKQFHFASRLGTWANDKACTDHLQNMRATLLPGIDYRDVLANLAVNPPASIINAAGKRQAYFDKYPELRGLNLALFRVRHALYIYGVDLREDMLAVRNLDYLQDLASQLLADREGLKILSTYAINYLFLIRRMLFADDHTLDLSLFYEIGQEYKLDGPEDIMLLIYLYTHCIIGEANFYAWQVRPEQIDTCTKMLTKLEDLIERNYNSVNLDNKLEFLVCCRICGYESDLSARVYDECGQSVSPEGMFLIDTINDFPQSQKTSFSDSEHRNVLFIMSST